MYLIFDGSEVFNMSRMRVFWLLYSNTRMNGSWWCHWSEDLMHQQLSYLNMPIRAKKALGRKVDCLKWAHAPTLRFSTVLKYLGTWRTHLLTHIYRSRGLWKSVKDRKQYITKIIHRDWNIRSSITFRVAIRGWLFFTMSGILVGGSYIFLTIRLVIELL